MLKTAPHSSCKAIQDHFKNDLYISQQSTRSLYTLAMLIYTKSLWAVRREFQTIHSVITNIAMGMTSCNSDRVFVSYSHLSIATFCCSASCNWLALVLCSSTCCALSCEAASPSTELESWRSSCCCVIATWTKTCYWQHMIIISHPGQFWSIFWLLTSLHYHLHS